MSIVIDFPDDFPDLSTETGTSSARSSNNLVDNAIKYSPRGGKVLITGALAIQKQGHASTMCR